MLTRLQEWPRTPFVHEPTPLIRAPNLARLLARAPEGVLLKMDGESGFALGGNKARKLEFELAPDRLEGATHVITCGGPQSNHARLTAAAAARLGLKCVLVVNGDVSPPYRGNAYLYRLFGAEIRPVTSPKEGQHNSFQCLTGHTQRNQPQSGWPEYGCSVSKVLGAAHPSAPPYVNLFPNMQHRPYNAKGPGYLGRPHAAFMPEGETKSDLVLNGISVERLADRRRLLESFDRFRRRAESSDMMRGVDAFQQRAFDILTSSRLADALDLSKEDPRVRERYGTGTTKRQGDAAPRLMGQFLTARRLIEAGARCVTVAFSFWDWHGNNFGNARKNFPDLDQGVSALVEDLHERGLDKDVSVVVWGEFGRTPRINKQAGRDHWPKVTCALLAGGGMRTGQVIGSTTRDGGEAKDRPVTFPEVFATLYHNLGIDTDTTTTADLNGRPQYLVDGAKPIAELI